MLRAGVGFAAVMKLLGHTDPRMTMRYVDVTLTDLQREFQLARSKPRHLAPQPKTSATLLCAQVSMASSIPSQTAQHVLEMFRRSLPNGDKRNRLDRLANRLTKILAEITKTPHHLNEKWAEIGRLTGQITRRPSPLLPTVRSDGL